MINTIRWTILLTIIGLAAVVCCTLIVSAEDLVIISIDSPSDGETIYFDNITVSGFAAATDWLVVESVTVNGVRASGTPFWSCDISLQTGRWNTITAEATADSGQNNSTTITVFCITAPAAPQNLQLTADDDCVTLKWIAPEDDGGSEITKYNIYRGTAPGGLSRLNTVGNVLIYDDHDLTNDQRYYYQVSALNSVGEGEKSMEASASTPKLTPKPTSSPTSSPTSTPKPISTPKQISTPKPASTPIPTATATATSTPTPTSTPKPTSIATPTPTQETIDEILENLPIGKVLFNPPKEMEVGETELVEVRITQNLMDDLTKGLEGPGEPQIKETKVSTYMKVRLTGRNFDIDPKNGAPQMIESDKYTHWDFQVTPLKSGIQTLKLTYYVIISHQGADRQKEYEVGDWEVSVKVTLRGLFMRYWAFIVGTLIGIVGLIIAVIEIRMLRG